MTENPHVLKENNISGPDCEGSQSNPANLNLTFSIALIDLGHGYKVAREGWNGKGMWLCLQIPDALSKMTLPYIYIEYPVGHPAYPNGCRVPWLASQTDLLANDWFRVEETPQT
jgi:hypothetical protein